MNQNCVPNRIVLAFLLLFTQFSTAQKIRELHVSPNGSDTASGSLEHPYATLHRASQEIALITSDSFQKVVVWINGGTYRIKEPLLLDATLMKNSPPVAFKAIPESRPIITGAVQLPHWTHQGDGLWVSIVPEEIGNFRELFINGKRASRARYPNNDFLRVAKVGEDKRTHFTYIPNEFPRPKDNEGVELALLHDWSITRIAVKYIDSVTHSIHTVDSIGAKSLPFFTLDNWEANPRYYLENDIAFLDVPYEWFFDSNERKLSLKLPLEQNPSSLSIEVPLAKALLLLKGTEEHPISNVSFQGLTFKHCRWNIPSHRYAGIQAAHFELNDAKKSWKVVPAAVNTTWANNILFKDCEFLSMGGSAVWFGTGTKNSILKECRIQDISGNGIMIGEGQDRLIRGAPWWKVAPGHAALSNSIENCTISDCGVQFLGSVGIWCGLTAETSILDNEIYNLPYTGISMGWMWNPQPTPCRDNRIERNHIHHVLNTLSDGGGIYMLGLQPGSQLVDNHIHDISVNAGRAESNGMFLDEGTKDVLVEGNLIYNIAKSPLRFHKAYTNLVKGNYFFSSGKIPGIAYNRTQPNAIKKEGNHIISTDSIAYNALLKLTQSKFRGFKQIEK